jgi:hypothetical protein
MLRNLIKNILTSIQAYCASEVVNERVNAVHLAVATSGYRIQQSLHNLAIQQVKYDPIFVCTDHHAAPNLGARALVKFFSCYAAQSAEMHSLNPNFNLRAFDIK